MWAELTSRLYPLKDLGTVDEGDATAGRAMGEPAALSNLVDHCLSPTGAVDKYVCLGFSLFLITHSFTQSISQYLGYTVKL